MKLSDLSHTDIIGSTIGVIGIVLAIIFYFRGKDQSLPSYTVDSSVLIGPHWQELPDKVKIQYDGEPVQSLSKAVIFFWNRGRKTIGRDDVASADPLRFSFINRKTGGKLQILEIRSIWTTRDVLGVKASLKDNSIEMNFDFLDRADGFALEVLYAGDYGTQINWNGTIKGVPRGIRYFSPNLTYLPLNIKPIVKVVLLATGASLLGLLGAGVVAAIHDFAETSHQSWERLHPGHPDRFYNIAIHIYPIYGIIIGVGFFLWFTYLFYGSGRRNVPLRLLAKYPRKWRIV